MRGVFIHFRTASRGEIERLLDDACGSRPWGVKSDDEPVLWPGFYDELEQEFDPATIDMLTRALGGPPSASIAVEVTGRRSGVDEVGSFVASILDRFAGVAQDDFSDHFWSADEIRSGSSSEGRKFFTDAGGRC